MIQFKTTSTKEELKQILELQQKNLPKNISQTEKKEQGFVTVEHDLEILERMHNVQPHIIAVSNNRVVGYALCMDKQFKNDVPVLIPMFDEIDNSLKEDIPYILMGQVCVDKDFRGKGVFRGLYEKMKTEVKPTFEAIITEVDALNTRSSNAHKAIGFDKLTTYEAGGQLWELIILHT